jgi:hypothetical protein
LISCLAFLDHTAAWANSSQTLSGIVVKFIHCSFFRQRALRRTARGMHPRAPMQTLTGRKSDARMAKRGECRSIPHFPHSRGARCARARLDAPTCVASARGGPVLRSALRASAPLVFPKAVLARAARPRDNRHVILGARSVRQGKTGAFRHSRKSPMLRPHRDPRWGIRSNLRARRLVRVR